MKTDLLVEYLKKRAQIEGVCFELSQEDFLEPLFNEGIRNFFGVIVDNDCFPLYDEQEPEDHPGLLENFLIDKNYSSNLNSCNDDDLSFLFD